MATPELWLKSWEDGFHHLNLGPDPEKHKAPQHEDSHHASGPGPHGSQVDVYLRRHLDSLTEGKENLSIFITLCGNSPDLVWLCEKGYSVVGCEISAKAVEQLFENRVHGGKIDYEVKEEGGIKIYSATDGKKLKVYVGDFFGSLSPDMTGTFDCVWDCHGIISVPENLYATYAEKVIKFLKPGGRMLFSTIDSEIPVEKKATLNFHPNMSTAHLVQLFPSFNVEELENLESPWHKNLDGLWTNPVTLFTQKEN